MSRKPTRLPIMALAILLLSSSAIETNVHAYIFAMPEEQVTYTITTVNSVLWAIIDGTYPIIYRGNETSIPMIYPTPPGTTNISIWLNDDMLDWSNLTETQPNAIHHTAIGDWSEVLTFLRNVSGNFVLKIHYEHPIQVINGSYVFLYDLNIQEYLSPEQNASVAHFSVKMDNEFENLRVYTVDPETETLKSIAFSVAEERPIEATINEVSELNTPLPGDLMISFTEKTKGNDNIPIINALAILAAIIIGGAIGIILVRRRRNQQIH